MVDTRFHPSSGPLPLLEVLVGLGRQANIDGERAARLMIAGADELHLATPSDLAFAAAPEYRPMLAETKAGAVVVHSSLAADIPTGTLAIVDDRPQDLFVALLERLYPSDTRAVVAGACSGDGAAPYLEEGVRVGANVVFGDGVEVGRNTVIGANTVIGRGVTIGRNAVIGSNVTIECAHLGNNVVVHSGARIGSEGFGWLGQGRSNRKVPQLGRAILQDSVEIGSNTTIDRGALGDTVIGEGTKIDNLVQIGHNCHIGRYCLIAAHCGLSGSTVLEDSVLMGGRASTTGHLTVGKDTVIMGAGVATKDIPPGSKVGGYPAQDVRKWWREIATLRRLNQRGQE